MGLYGRAACMAADLVAAGESPEPRGAWHIAICRVTRSATSRNKSCPRSTFLALCETGAVKGVPAGRYTASPDNKRYALKAWHALLANPELADSSSDLWRVATDGALKCQNGQLDVLLTLWKTDRLDGTHF